VVASAGSGSHFGWRRLLLAIGATSVLAAVGAPAALADVGLPGPTTAPPTAPAAESPTTAAAELTVPVEQTVAQVATPAAPETAAPAQQPTIPSLTDTAHKAVEEPVQTATQAAAPLVESGSTAAAPVLEPASQVAAPVVGKPQTSVQESLEVVTDAVAPLVEQVAESAAPIAASAERALETLAPLTGDSAHLEAGVVATAPPNVSPSSVSPTRPAAAGSVRSPSSDLVAFGNRGSHVTELPNLPSALAVGLAVAPSNGNAPMSPTQRPHVPLPDFPPEPLTEVFSASASAGVGALMILLAALAAALFLAAPGLGRRLRPRLASWPQPSPHLSLERPG